MKPLLLNFAAPPLLDFEAFDENDAIRRTTELMAFHSGITHFGAFVDAIGGGGDQQRVSRGPEHLRDRKPDAGGAARAGDDGKPAHPRAAQTLRVQP